MAYVSKTRCAKALGVKRIALNIAEYTEKLDTITLKSGRKLYWVDDDILEAYKRHAKEKKAIANKRYKRYMERKNERNHMARAY